MLSERKQAHRNEKQIPHEIIVLYENKRIFIDENLIYAYNKLDKLQQQNVQNPRFELGNTEYFHKKNNWHNSNHIKKNG